MFEASVDGQPYDVERFGQYYRPYGVDAPAGSSTDTSAAPATTPTAPTPAPAPVAETPAPAPQTETVAAPAEAPAGESKRAEDILAMIRNRQS